MLRREQHRSTQRVGGKPYYDGIHYDGIPYDDTRSYDGTPYYGTRYTEM